jgi:hypothetical protein
MPINLTKVLGRVNKIKTKLFCEEGVTAKLKSGNEVKLTLTEKDGFYIPQNPQSNLALGQEYFEMTVANPEIDLEEALLFSNLVEFQGEDYEIKAFFRPRGLTQKWVLRLQTVGNKGL